MMGDIVRSKTFAKVPAPGQWPVGPQTDLEISRARLWIDGCFDFSHHGHAGAILQAKRLGKQLVVGVHSDEDIMENKGPTVMTLKERVSAVNACRWVNLTVPHAPYVTSLDWISHYGCYAVIHGDDITTDSGGEDCYRFVKDAGRFLLVKRTPGISTTDLVGRMLLCTKTHFIKSFASLLSGEEGPGNTEERKQAAQEMKQRIKDYASDESGLMPGAVVLSWNARSGTVPIHKRDGEFGAFSLTVDGTCPRPGQRIVYVDGGFDLFSSGHIEFLRQVLIREEALGDINGWFNNETAEQRIRKVGEDYGPAYIVAGIHDDTVINHWKGVNYPIMNIFERGLCVLQCRFINAIIFSAPFIPDRAYLTQMPWGLPHAVYHGPTSFIPLTLDPYIDAKNLNIYEEIGRHEFQHVNAGEIVQRILRSREMYEARQRMKGVKATVEEAIQTKEQVGRVVAEMEERQRKLQHECDSLRRILDSRESAADVDADADADADGVDDDATMGSSPPLR